MEYMHLADGSFKVIDHIETAREVMVLLQKHNARGYYWVSHTTGDWMVMTKASTPAGGVIAHEVPPEILLAHMLE